MKGEFVKMKGPFLNHAEFFSISVAIDGDTAVIGAHSDDGGGTNSGAAYVFVRSGGVWSQQQKLIASDAEEFEHSGLSVALFGDTVVIGAPDDDAGGAAYVFVRSAEGWSQQQKLIASDTETDDLLGYSVAVSGNTIVIGAPDDDNNNGDSSGSAYIFTAVMHDISLPIVMTKP